MGIAAYNRGNRVISEQLRAELNAQRNTLDNRAQLWKLAMEAGMVLRFKMSGGDTLTCGPFQAAVPGPRFAAFRYDHRGREVASCEATRAWEVALFVIDHVGRKRPVNLDED